MLLFHHGNDLATLRLLAAHRLAQSPPPPLQPEYLVVPNGGMAKWLRRGVAATQGIAADLSCDSPAVFLRRIAAIVLGGLADSSQDPWSKDLLTVRLMGLLPGLLAEPGFAPLAAYLADTRDPRRLLALSRQLASLFDQYLIWRTDWILEWERGLPGQNDPARDNPWQPVLWRALSAAVRAAHPGTLHPPAMIEMLCERLTRGAPPSGLPARVTGFGLGALPPGLLSVLRALGAHLDVQVFQFNPCQEFWADVQSERTLAQWRLHAPERALYAESGNALLASWGRLGAAQLGLLLDADVPLEFHFREPNQGTLLGCIQQDILCLRESTGSAPLTSDGSILFAETHSRLREVEALHDALLDMIERFPALTPRDIVVMAPDIAPYAPHIEAVFGELRNDPRFLPFAISDRSSLAEEPLTRSFLHLLSLPRSRFSASEVLGLLAVPAIGECAGFASAEIESLHELVVRSGVRWGYDDTGSAGEGPALARNTWRFGLERLLLGVALDDGTLFDGVAPLGVNGAAEAEQVGRLAAFVDGLAERAAQLQTPRTPALWREQIHSLFADFISTEPAHAAARAELLAAVNTAIDSLDIAGCVDELAREVVQDLIETHLNAAETSHAFLRAGVSFCQLTPLRSIPFRAVCLLGMNAADFPRNRERPAFDLMRAAPRRGDPSRRDDDRFLFLESVLAARDCLYISRVAADERSNAALEPAVPLSELREYIDRCHGEGSAAALTVRHALKPFHPSYFDGSGARFSFRGEWCPAAEAMGAAPSPFCPAPLAQRPEPVIRPDDLVRFFQRPCETFFSARLEVRFDKVEESVEDIEPLELGTLEGWSLRRDLLEASLSGREHAVDAQLLATGALPQGAAGERLIAKSRAEVAKVLDTVRNWAPARSERVSLDLDMQRIEGEIGGLRGTALQEYSVSEKLSGKHAVAFWVRHLIACAAGLVASPSEHVNRKAKARLPVIAPDVALTHLRDLAAVRSEGLCEPLPLFPKAAFVRTELLEGNAAKARSAALVVFLPGWGDSPGECEDAYVSRAFPDAEQALDSRFEALSERVFRPLVAALAEGGKKS